MKKTTIMFLAGLLLTSCNGWFFQPSPLPLPTPFLPPTQTPSIVSPTPVVVGVSSATPIVATSTMTAITDTPPVIASDTPSLTATVLVPNPSLRVEILGCDTSIDVSHGMGEVTNAYVKLSNIGNVDLSHIRVKLAAEDEEREHPDKTVTLTSLPVNYQVSVKLTVDSAYREATSIQVEVAADPELFQRHGFESCRDIGLFAPEPNSLRTPVPMNP